MRRIAVVLPLLFALTAGADPVMTRGGALKKRAYQTYATTTLYVDPTGSDSNSCTASGTSACLTVTGVLAKLPRFIQNNVTINLAAGTYNEGVTVTGFHLANGVTFAITGTMSSFTVATGTNSGTTTASSAGSSAGPATITDSGQSWTTNDLRGRFITFSSGTLNGQSFPIYANTATTVTFPTTLTPGTGVTYSIQTPGSIIAGGASGHTFSNCFGTGTMTVTNVEWSRTSGTVLMTYGNSSHSTTFTNNRFMQSGTSFAINHTGGSLSISRSYMESSATSTGMQSQAITGTSVVRSGFTNSVIRMTSAGAATAYRAAQGTAGSSFFTGSIAEGTGTSSTTPLVSIDSGNNTTQMPSIWITCTTASGSIGLGAITITSSVPPSFSAITNNGGTRITGCGTGVRVSAGQRWSMLSPAFDTCTTAFNVEKGGRLDFASGTPTFSTVTNEILLDGTAYTFSTLSGLPSPQVISNSYGSTLIR